MNPPERQKLLIILTLVAVGLYAGNLALYEPLSKWYASRAQQITDLRQRVKQGDMLVRREVGIRSEWDNMRTNTLPVNGSLAEQQLLKSFNTWAGDAGVEITDVLPQWKSDSDDYINLTCQVKAGGNLNSLMQFLYRIKQSPMALKVDTLQLSSRDTSGQQLDLEVMVNGLVLVPKIQK